MRYVSSPSVPETKALLGFVDCCEFSVYVFTVKMLTENSQQSMEPSEDIVSVQYCIC